MSTNTIARLVWLGLLSAESGADAAPLLKSFELMRVSLSLISPCSGSIRGPIRPDTPGGPCVDAYIELETWAA